MKQLFFILLFISASTFVFAQFIPPPDKTIVPPVKKEKKKKVVKTIVENTESYIIVFRGGQFASALSNYNIFIDGRKICKLSNGKYFKYPVPPGKHEIEAKKAGVDIMKKETFANVITRAGKNSYISCNIKTGLLREKIEMIEVVENSGKQYINNLKEDNCQGEIK